MVNSAGEEEIHRGGRYHQFFRYGGTQPLQRDGIEVSMQTRKEQRAAHHYHTARNTSISFHLPLREEDKKTEIEPG